MTAAEITNLAAFYGNYFVSHEIPKKDLSGEERPWPMETCSDEILAHCHAKLAQIGGLLKSNHLEEAMQSLVFIQTCLFCTHQFSLRELEGHNRAA